MYKFSYTMLWVRSGGARVGWGMGGGGEGVNGYIKSKVKACVYSSDINYPQVLEPTLSQTHLPGENTAQFSAAEAINTVPIFVPPSTHYC